MGRDAVGTVDPDEAIIPIFGVDEHDSLVFLGTGSVVGDGTIVLTADHVTRDWHQKLAFITRDHPSRRWSIELIERDPRHDLVLYRIRDYPIERPLQLMFDAPIAMNRELMTYDYGTTVTAGGKVTLSPVTHLGHMTRMINRSEQYGPAGIQALELSWPALRGASGAPVMFGDNPFNTYPSQSFGVVGVVIANVSYHLLPSQIESVLDEKNNVYEEIRYMLPQALAVNIEHVRPMYERAINSG